MLLEKNFKLFVARIIILAIATMAVAFAEDVTIIGSMPHTLKKDNSASASKAFGSSHNEMVIQLLHIQLSPDAKNNLRSRRNDLLAHRHEFSRVSKDVNSSLPNKIQIAMNNVPVLDQGRHGTCVTFAVTGAIDAVIGKGDYISQLCNLQLGNYLELHGYGSSGWNGSHASNVISQITQFGVINMQNQQAFGCGGLTKYPMNTRIKRNSYIEPENFRALSEFIFGTVVNWSDEYDKTDSVASLNNVKQALDAGNRLVFAVLLPRTDLGMVGAVGRHNTWFYKDTWLLTAEILKGLDSIESAHEMIITGYDDDAVAKDENGKISRGLLTLRNSWGGSVGDYGEFYMSYDYFKLLAYDVIRITPN